ncbi:hypothetical protein GCM10018790_70270 [Kitasatospora xanthocidica]|nr:hypothetical protein GCM10018790_70270 [Kitasatospora xanthocidica]
MGGESGPFGAEDLGGAGEFEGRLGRAEQGHHPVAARGGRTDKGGSGALRGCDAHVRNVPEDVF